MSTTTHRESDLRAQAVPRHPSNRQVYDKLIAWGWQLGSMFMARGVLQYRHVACAAEEAHDKAALCHHAPRLQVQSGLKRCPRHGLDGRGRVVRRLVQPS